MDKNGGTFLNYQVEMKDKLIRFELENGTSDEFKWFALGWSNSTDMKNVDFCVVVDDKKRVFVSFCKRRQPQFIPLIFLNFKDGHSSEDGKTLVIDSQQDCKRRVITNEKEAAKNKVRFNRAFKTNDKQDNEFTEKKTHLFFIQGKETVIIDGDVTLDLTESKTKQSKQEIQFLKSKSTK